MAALPQNNTDRWFLDYVTGSAATSTEHTMSIRGDGNLGIDGAMGTFVAILNGIGAANLWTGWKPVRMRHQAQGSQFSLPVTMGATLASFVGTGSATGYLPTIEAMEATVQGRSHTTGRRGDLSIYGVRFNGLPSTFRITAASGAPWSTLLNALAGLAVPMKAIDGSDLVWYPYVNLNFNSYWETRIRSV